MRRTKTPERRPAESKGARAAAKPRRRPEKDATTPAGPEARQPGRGLLFSQLSHDLRNPLSVMLVSAQMLKRQLPAEHAARRYVDAVERGSEELNQILDELSDTARIEDGCLRDVLRAEPVDLPALLEEAVAVSRPLAESKHLALTTRADAAVGPIVCDRARIRRVIGCLVAGAVRITPKHGAVAVEVGRDRGGAARLVITDGGPSVPAASQASLFELPSGKIPATARRATPQGSALTLFVARHVVEAHGGTMTATHEEGKGTTFVVTLPPRGVEPVETETA